MFNTHRLDAAIRERAARLETERRELFARVAERLAIEARELGIREAYVIGSLAAEGMWTDESDVDVAIAGGDPLVVMQVLEAVAERAVDVVDLDRHPEPDLFRRRGSKVIG